MPTDYQREMPRFFSLYFGCRANQADGAAIEKQLTERGFQSVHQPDQAEVVFLNSCTVTAAADNDLRQTVRKIHRKNPQARILITGCYAQRRPEDLASLPGVQWVVGNSYQGEIGNLLGGECGRAAGDDAIVPAGSLRWSRSAPAPDSDLLRLGSTCPAPSPSGPVHPPIVLVGDIFAQQTLSVAPVFGAAAADRTRPNLKIQDGCHQRCSFCVIPYVRGRSRSLLPEQVLDHIRALTEAGYREVVLSGVNLGRYGRDLPRKTSLVALLRRVLAETSLERVRLSSVEPTDWSEELLDLMAASSRIAKHVHAPLQSGSDRILRRMHRKYHPHNYRERILAAYERMPNAAFGADVMVGFPGETEEDFRQTRHFIEEMPFTYLHVFPFSRRPGTAADKMKEQVQGSLVRERGRVLRELGAAKNRAFRERQRGRILSGLTLQEVARGGTTALSENYLKVSLPGERLPPNQLIRLRIVGLAGAWLVGERIVREAKPA